MGTLWGPMLGAAAVVILEESLAGIATWEIILGGVVVVVIFAPRGLAGLLAAASDDPRHALANVKGALKTYVKKVRGRA